MSETLTLPVLPLDDDVVLPGMVVPLETSQPEVGAAIDAARVPSRQVPGMRSETKARVLVVPRLADRGLAGVGTLAVVEQVGRLPGGQPGAVVRGIARVKIGSGTTGPGAALWVEGTVIEETNLGPQADELAQQYKTLITSMLQQRGAWQVIDAIQQLTSRPRRSCSCSRPPTWSSALSWWSAGPRTSWPRWKWPSPSARTCPRAWRSSRRNSCSASSSPRCARSSPT
jgi:ATP-dependent Lon protease